MIPLNIRYLADATQLLLTREEGVHDLFAFPVYHAVSTGPDQYTSLNEAKPFEGRKACVYALGISSTIHPEIVSRH